MPRFGSVSLPFLGLVTADRRSRNMGLGLDIDRQTGITVWLSRWELNADTLAAFALPIHAPIAMLAAFLPRLSGNQG